MEKSKNQSSSNGGKLDTLGRNETSLFEVTNQQINGEGSDMRDEGVRLNKGKRKFITQRLSLAIADVAIELGDPEKAQQCYNAYHCQSKILWQQGRTFGNYCKNKICLVCSSIRKAELINKYSPILMQWENAYFVTLTVKACKAPELRWKVDGMLKTFTRLKRRYDKRYQRKDKWMRFQGIRSLECNFNPVRRTYNPHFHLIVPNRKIAERLIEDWMKEWGPIETNPQGQHKRSIKDMERDMVETIKYGSKIFTESKTLNSALKTEKSTKIFARAFYVILKAFEGRKLFTHFGFKVEKQPHQKVVTLINKGSVLTYIHKARDWVNLQTGSIFSGFEADKELEELVRGIDKRLA